jgi:PIN domain nuclease of toxin-antitoxin system
MNYLLDTHVFLWWIFDDPKLDRQSRAIISNPKHIIWVSSASAWEISTKYRIGKLPEAKTVLENYTALLDEAGFCSLSITEAHALRAGNLPIPHRDPFDRMLMAQSELEQFPILTHDRAFFLDFLTVISP